MDVFYTSEALEEGVLSPLLCEWDNPIFSLSKTKDAVALCAESVFGIKTLKPYQRMVIANILDAVEAGVAPMEEDGAMLDDFYDEDGVLRAHQIVLLPTGAGKSLCFQIPALLLEGATLVVYPLLALMNDQFQRLDKVGLQPVLLRGGQSKEERATQFARLDGTGGHEPAKIIIANPEVLQNPTVLERLKKRDISFIAIDEAHCISEWGDTFRPSYLQLPHIIEELQPKSITAFTATAGEHILKRIKDVLFNGKAHLLQGASDRPNLFYNVIRCRAKTPILLQLLSACEKPAIVFCSSRNGAERRAEMVQYRLDNADVRFYHAELSREEKEAIEAWFHASDTGILIATCAWGMGIDKKNVRTVIHFDPSPTIESYLQESGRAGRDSAPAQLFLLWSPADTKRIEALPKNQRHRATLMKNYADTTECRRAFLLNAIGDMPENRGEGDRVFCAQCDLCTGTGHRGVKDEDALYSIIKRYNRRLTRAQLIELCTEAASVYRSRDINLLINALEEENKIKIPQHGLWKGVMCISTHKKQLTMHSL